MTFQQGPRSTQESGTLALQQNTTSLKYTEKNTTSLKYIDDCSIGAAINMTEALILETEVKARPLTYQERTGHKIMTDHNILQQQLYEFHHFTTSNKFKINEKKSEVMIFNFSKQYAFPPNLSIGNSDISREVKSTKLLGVFIHDNLKWDENTQYICSRASEKLWL